MNYQKMSLDELKLLHEAAYAAYLAQLERIKELNSELKRMCASPEHTTLRDYTAVEQQLTTARGELTGIGIKADTILEALRSREEDVFAAGLGVIVEKAFLAAGIEQSLSANEWCHRWHQLQQTIENTQNIFGEAQPHQYILNALGLIRDWLKE